MNNATVSADRPRSGMLGALAPNLAIELVDYFRRHRAGVESLIEGADSRSGLDAGRAGARAFDGLLSTLFLAACSVVGAPGSGFRASIAAVGSYGRGALALHSDIDVRLLFEGDRDRAQRLAEEILYPLWDVHVAVGHQVVQVDELIALARQDPRTATTLLDWRGLSGDESLGSDLLRKAFDHVFSEAGVPAFVELLERDTLARHEKFGATIYRLEPDIKLGAGGMRDLDVALWAARARWRVQRIEDLVRLGVLVPREIAEIVAARAHLWRVRNQLHLAAKRRSDRLSFDQQERIAPLLGFGTGTDGAEAFMSAHYQHALAIMHAREIIAGRAMERPRSRRPAESDLGSGLKSFDGHLIFASAATLASHPDIALRIYEQAVRLESPIHPSSREALRRALRLPSFRQAVSASSSARSRFLALCSTVRETRLKQDSILGDIHDVGLLTTMIPEFEPLVGRVHHDVYHSLTVDVHSIAALDRLRQLARGSLPGDSPLACRLAAEMARPIVLFLAVLLHDVGKAIGGKDHSTRGAPIAFEVAKRLGLSEDDASEVSHLVNHHLALYHAATRRDLEDPLVIDDIARLVHGREGLRELYLLTYVDVGTTSPDAMTTWKAAVLEQLFQAVDAHLLGQGVSARSPVARLAASMSALPDTQAFLLSMPERYVLATDPSRVRDHARLVEERAPGKPSVAVFEATLGACAEVCVVTDDRPGLLAAIAASLAGNRLQVLEAQVYSRTRRDGGIEAVDLFMVRGPAHATIEDLRRAGSKMQKDLQAILDGALSPDDVVMPRMLAALAERPSPAVETRVVIDNRASTKLTVVEVFSRDRPGLLYVLASTFRDLGLSIEIAKINTEGTRVADVFYVSEPDGAKVKTGVRAEELRSCITTALERHSTRRS